MQSIALWLEQTKPQAVGRIVERIYAELPDYRQRSVDELTVAANRAYDQWCGTVLANDLMRYAAEAEAVIQQNVARNYNPAQLSRIPAVIHEVVAALLAEAGTAVDPEERALFQARADRLTRTILGVGGLKIMSTYLKKTIADGDGSPPGAGELPGS